MKYIWAVAIREFKIWLKRPIYFIGSLTTMIFSAVFFLTMLHDGLPSDLPIGIVDYDNSSLSRNFIQQLDATQLGHAIEYQTFADAREDMQRGVITSVCVLPSHMYADVLANRRPTFTFYVNGLYFVGGSLAYKDILTMINLTSGAVQRGVLRAKGVNENAILGRIRPISIDTHQIGNTTTNYGIYLNNILLPGILQMMAVLVMIYAFGTELKYKTSHHLLGTSNGSILYAIMGKLLLYLVYFSIVGLTLMMLLYDWMHYPLAGSIWNMFMAICLMVLACCGVALLLVCLIPVCRLAVSIGALYSVLGLSMAGFTLPVEAMLPEIQGLSFIFPLRHYYQFFVQEAIFDSGFVGWYHEVIHLLLFLLLPIPFLGRLKRAYIYQNYPIN